MVDEPKVDAIVVLMRGGFCVHENPRRDLVAQRHVVASHVNSWRLRRQVTHHPDIVAIAGGLGKGLDIATTRATPRQINGPAAAARAPRVC